MPQQTSPSGSVVIPDEIRAKFPDLIDLILNSESMNDEERQYWINILPIMTPEQIQNLREILENEKRQLQEIDKKYAGTLSAAQQREVVAKTEEERKQRRMERKGKEYAAEKKESEATDDLLKQIENI
ncbi:hypothetical protein FJZ28_03585 [Candidatus Peregrinibacteria bacterium]|nr:hypothetical protein [Candidatus Peregrinibacteria bacterium]